MIDLKQDFEQVRQAYPGIKRGLEAEYDNYLIKLKRWKLKEYDITHKLLPAIEAQITMRDGKEWNEGWKHFSTWINNRWWEAIDNKGTKAPVLCCVCHGHEWVVTVKDKPICGDPACKKAIRGY